jgi:hypothetical protein
MELSQQLQYQGEGCSTSIDLVVSAENKGIRQQHQDKACSPSVHQSMVMPFHRMTALHHEW